MELEASHKKILEYLQKYGVVNTFKLSRQLGIDRSELISIIKDLTRKRLAFIKHGSVSINEIKYQKFIENKESLNISKPVSKPKAEKPKFKTQENKGIKKRQQLKKEIEELQSKKSNIAQQLAEEIRLLNSIREEKTEIGDIAARAAEKERFLKQKKEEMKKREESVSAAEKKLEDDKEALRKEQENVKKRPRAKARGVFLSTPKIPIGIFERINKQKSEIEALKPKIEPTENEVSKSETNKADLEDALAEDIKKQKEEKGIKPKRKRAVKKAKLKKGRKKSKEAGAKRLRKGKQEKLESWLRQAKLEIERLKVEIELASMSHNTSKIWSLEASAAKLRNMIDWRMREK